MNDISCCGTDCSACYCYGKMCQGCNEAQGKVFHAPEGQPCPIYECSVNTKNYPHCGNCDKVPCEIWEKTRDPKFTDEEFKKNVGERMANINNMKGVE